MKDFHHGALQEHAWRTAQSIMSAAPSEGCETLCENTDEQREQGESILSGPKKRILGFPWRLMRHSLIPTVFPGIDEKVKNSLGMNQTTLSEM